jgi:ssDNA-binding Zn-finger/Zn-ribbon topoisomerase 1
MKLTHQCPKCQSADIVKEDKKNNAFYTNYVFVKKNWASYINLTRYICLHCGYTEEWVDDPSDLDKIEKKYKKQNKDYDGFV